jgi:hypothetical protein
MANRDCTDFGWEIAHGAVTRRPPIALYSMVPRTGCYACDVAVWDLSIVEGPISCRPRAKPSVTIRDFPVRCRYGALKTLGEKKSTFHEWTHVRGKEMREERRVEAKANKAQFIVMLGESERLKSTMR